MARFRLSLLRELILRKSSPAALNDGDLKAGAAMRQS
jgi:hypothetical protein